MPAEARNQGAKKQSCGQKQLTQMKKVQTLRLPSRFVPVLNWLMNCEDEWLEHLNGALWHHTDKHILEVQLKMFCFIRSFRNELSAVFFYCSVTAIAIHL